MKGNSSSGLYNAILEPVEEDAEGEAELCDDVDNYDDDINYSDNDPHSYNYSHLLIKGNKKYFLFYENNLLSNLPFFVRMVLPM